jgi:hypothetical protein
MEIYIPSNQDKRRLDLTDTLRWKWFRAASAATEYVVLVEEKVPSPVCWRWRVYYCESNAEVQSIFRLFPRGVGGSYVYEIMKTSEGFRPDRGGEPAEL